MMCDMAVYYQQAYQDAVPGLGALVLLTTGIALYLAIFRP